MIVTNQTSVHQPDPARQRVDFRVGQELEGCVCCGSRVAVIRAARFGYVPFCEDCLERSLRHSEWDDLGEAGD